MVFPGVKLEDVSVLGNKLPLAEEVINKERKEQAELRGGEAWIKEQAAERRARDKKAQ